MQLKGRERPRQEGILADCATLEKESSRARLDLARLEEFGLMSACLGHFPARRLKLKTPSRLLAAAAAASWETTRDTTHATLCSKRKFSLTTSSDRQFDFLFFFTYTFQTSY